MAATNRSNILTKLHRVLKKHYKPVPIDPNRTLLEHAIHGICLENAPDEAADRAYGILKTEFFDWNEIRVTTVKELAETINFLPNANRAASKIKRFLQNVFESQYSFDIEILRKATLKVALKKIEEYGPLPPFALSRVIQLGLGGHSIPVDALGMELFFVLGVITEENKKKQVVPGLDRVIAKSKGIEFSTLYHQLAVAFGDSPYSNNIRAILIEVDPEVKQRLPKRKAATKKKAAPKKSAKKAPAKKAAPKKSAKKKTAAATAKKTVKKKAATKKAAPKKTGTKKTAAKKTPAIKTATKKKTTAATKSISRKKPR